MERTLILTIGIPGSGKSTFVKELGEKFNIKVVSSDKVRESLYGDEEIQGDYNEVFDEVYRQVNHWLDLYEWCILDATHCTRWSRWAAVARTCPDRVIYIKMNQDIDKALAQNASRKRVCPEHVIRRMAKNLLKEPPRDSEVRNLYIYSYDDPQLIYDLEQLK